MSRQGNWRDSIISWPNNIMIKKAKNGSFKHGDMVLLHDPISNGKLNSIWEGPYKVLGALSKTLYKFSVPKKSGKYKMSTLTNLNPGTHPLPTFSLW